MRVLFLLLVSVFTLMAQIGGAGGGPSQLPPGNSPPRVIQRTEPDYTKEALDAKVDGFVVLSITITVEGTATNIQVVKGFGLGLDEKAVECLKMWRFTPAVRNGQAISTKATVELRFKLPDSH